MVTYLYASHDSPVYVGQELKVHDHMPVCRVICVISVVLQFIYIVLKVFVN